MPLGAQSVQFYPRSMIKYKYLDLYSASDVKDA